MANGDHGRGKDFDGRTFLYIRTHALDNGTEPLPAGLEAWLSPDIIVIKPDGTRGGEAVIGGANQVEVTVTNDGGIAAVDAYVEAFVADPSLSFTPANATPVGAGFLTIPGYSRQAITFGWMPTASELGHRCLAARVRLTIPPDGYYDGTVFDVRGDRHVAQRNISVVSLGTSQAMAFGFQVVNPAGTRRRVNVQVRPVTDPQRLKWIGQSLGSDLLRFSTRELRTFGVEVVKARKADELSDVTAAPVREARAASTAIPKSRTVRVDMGPHEVRQCRLVVGRDANASLGDLHVLEVVQADGRQAGGGLTVVVQH